MWDLIWAGGGIGEIIAKCGSVGGSLCAVKWSWDLAGTRNGGENKSAFM